MEWQPIETAPISSSSGNKNYILIYYIKDGKMKNKHRHLPVIIEACGYTDWRNNGNSVVWLDKYGQLIVMTGSNSATNIVTHWMPKPPEPGS
jgi:hypothetical protein